MENKFVTKLSVRWRALHPPGAIGSSCFYKAGNCRWEKGRRTKRPWVVALGLVNCTQQRNKLVERGGETWDNGGPVPHHSPLFFLVNFIFFLFGAVSVKKAAAALVSRLSKRSETTKTLPVGFLFKSYVPFKGKLYLNYSEKLCNLNMLQHVLDSALQF